MTTKRDPRVDPRPGDVVRCYPHGCERTIIARDGDRLLWESVWPDFEGQSLRAEGECDVALWRARNADAEVVHVAEVGK